MKQSSPLYFQTLFFACFAVCFLAISIWSPAHAMKISDGIRYASGLKLDVYQPDRSGGLFAKKKPVVIYIHGGGWVVGDRKRV
ncbi:MAG: hypothetical protein AAGF25_14790, partial [Pseudomonadota bacterium]